MESKIKVNIKMIANYDSIGGRIDEICNFNLLNKSKRSSFSFASSAHKKPKSIEKDYDWYFMENPKKYLVGVFEKIHHSPLVPDWIVFTNEMYAIDCDKTLDLLDAYFDSKNPVCVCSDVLWNNQSLDSHAYDNLIKKFMPKSIHKHHSNWSGATHLNSHPSGSFALSRTALSKIVQSEYWNYWKKEIDAHSKIDEGVAIGILMTFMKIPMPNIKFMSESFNLGEFTYMKHNGKCSLIKVNQSDSKDYSVYKNSINGSKRIEPIAAIDSASRLIKNKDVSIKIKLAEKEMLSGIIILNENKKALFTEKRDWNFSWKMVSPGNIVLINEDDKEIGEIKYATNKKNCHVMIKEGRHPITTFGTIYE